MYIQYGVFNYNILQNIIFIYEYTKFINFNIT